jgi:cell division septal protein FtsQ
MNNNISKSGLKLSSQTIRELLIKSRKYVWLLLLVFFVVVYGYILLQINSFSHTQPSQLQVSSYQKTSAAPPINPAVVNKLEQMKNNSVSVQALFNQARSNPF